MNAPFAPAASPSTEAPSLMMELVMEPVLQGCLRAACILAARDFALTHHSITEMDLIADRRSDATVMARRLFVWAVRTVDPDISYPAIGALLGGMHHTSTADMHRKAIALRLTDTAFAAACDGFLQYWRREREKPLV